MAEKSLTEIESAMAAALSGSRDAVTGIYYGVNGTGPTWWEMFCNVMFSVSEAARPAVGFRLYQDSSDGALQVSVQPGKVWWNGALIEYAGETNLDLTDNIGNYIYFDLATEAVAVQTSSYPYPRRTPHLRLGAITTSGGTYSLYTNRIDARSQAIWTPQHAGKQYAVELLLDPTDYQTEDTSATRAEFVLPARHEIADCMVLSTDSGWGGGDITDLSLEVGRAGDADAFHQAVDIFTGGMTEPTRDHADKGVDCTAQGTRTGIVSMTDDTDVQCTITATGANLSELVPDYCDDLFVYLRIIPWL